LRGATPGDLPVEEAATFKLTLNLKTAKALGIEIPQSILMRADEVIDDAPRQPLSQVCDSAGHPLDGAVIASGLIDYVLFLSGEQIGARRIQRERRSPRRSGSTVSCATWSTRSPGSRSRRGGHAG